MRLKTNVLKFLHRLEQLPMDSPVKWAYYELQALDKAGYHTWVSRAMNVFTDFHSISNMSIQSFTLLSRPSMKIKVKKYYNQHFEKNWLLDINSREKCPKLRTYCLFKKKFQLEDYLLLPNKKHRISISRFRMSSHHLAIEIGRHSRPKVPEEKRVCAQCKEIQNELHHLLICSPLADLRKPLLRSASVAIPDFDSLGLEHKFSEILVCTNVNVMTELAIFLCKADDLLRGPLRHTP